MKITELNGLKIIWTDSGRFVCLKSICQELDLDYGLLQYFKYRQRYEFDSDVLVIKEIESIAVEYRDFIKILVFEATKTQNKKAIAWLCALAEIGVNKKIK